MSAAAGLIDVTGADYYVQLKIATEYATYAADEREPVKTMVEVRGLSSNSASTAPFEVVYVIDASGSMQDAMATVNAAMQFVCQSTPEHHSVAVVTFADEAAVYWPMTRMTAPAKQQLKSRLPPTAHGMTNLAQALYQGMTQFSAPASGDVTQRFLVLLSDGMPTVGPASSSAILDVCRRHPQFENVQIMTMALGNDVDATLLSELSLKSRGKMYYIKSTDQLPVAFGDCLGTLLTLSASRLSIQIEVERDLTAPSCQPRSLSTAIETVSLSARQIDFVIGSLYEGEQRNVLVEVPADTDSFIVRVRYIELATGVPQTLERRMIVARGTARTGRNADVAVQLLRVEGQHVITNCARTGTDQGLRELEQRIHSQGLQEHPIGRCLLLDIRNLLDVFAQSQEQTSDFHSNIEIVETSLRSRGPRRAVTLSASDRTFEMACTNTSTGLATGNNNTLRIPSLRRALSEACASQASQPTS